MRLIVKQNSRIIWFLLVMSAIAGIIYISLELSLKFQSSPLATVVESTIFPVSEIAYPAVTICTENRYLLKKIISVFC